MSPREYAAACQWLSFPRVSGDEPAPEYALASDLEFSPRERG